MTGLRFNRLSSIVKPWQPTYTGLQLWQRLDDVGSTAVLRETPVRLVLSKIFLQLHQDQIVKEDTCLLSYLPPKPVVLELLFYVNLVCFCISIWVFIAAQSSCLSAGQCASWFSQGPQAGLVGQPPWRYCWWSVVGDHCVVPCSCIPECDTSAHSWCTLSASRLVSSFGLSSSAHFCVHSAEFVATIINSWLLLEQIDKCLQRRRQDRGLVVEKRIRIVECNDLQGMYGWLPPSNHESSTA